MALPQNEREFQESTGDLHKRLDILQQIAKTQRQLDDDTRPRELAERRYQLLLKSRLRTQEQAAHLEREMVGIRDKQSRASEIMRRDTGGAYTGLQGHAHSAVRTLANGASAFGASITSLARQGFQGTVEQNRLDTEWKLLTREFAGAFKPVIETMTSGVKIVRKFMQGLDGAGQNMVMVAGLLGSAFVAVKRGRFALQTVSGLAGVGAGVPAAASATNAMIPAGGNGGDRKPKAKSKPGTPASSRMGIGGMIGTGIGIGAAIDSGIDSYDRFSSTGFTGRNIANFAGKSLATLPFASQGLDFFDSQLEKAGFAGGKDPNKSGHRLPTPADFSYDEAGSAYQRASLSYLNNDAEERYAAGKQNDTPKKEDTDYLKQITEMIAKYAFGLERPETK